MNTRTIASGSEFGGWTTYEVYQVTEDIFGKAETHVAHVTCWERDFLAQIRLPRFRHTLQVTGNLTVALEYIDNGKAERAIAAACAVLSEE